MRQRHRALAYVFLCATALLSWISGCSDLENDCKLLVNCPETKEPPNCSGRLYSASCDVCLQAHCCQEVSDCLDNNLCESYCMFGILPPAPECTTGQVGQFFGDLTSCLTTNCGAECGATSYCNPITHGGCPTDGSSCDFFYPGIFACITIQPGEVPAQICEACNFSSGPYCGSGMRCDIASMTCARYCCTDADCGTGYCELNQNVTFGYSTANPAEMVGLCLAMAPETGPACDAPGIPPPSGGTCFVGHLP